MGTRCAARLYYKGCFEAPNYMKSHSFHSSNGAASWHAFKCMPLIRKRGRAGGLQYFAAQMFAYTEPS